MTATPPTALIIVDHGSRYAEANEMLDSFAAMVRRLAEAGTRRFVAVEPAHMELAEPSLETAFDRCVAAGARRVVVSQFFLSPGRHSTTDIPRLVAEAAGRHPGVRSIVCEPLGPDEQLAALILARAEQALGKANFEF